MSTNSNAAAAKGPTGQERRDNYRVDSPVQLRLRPLVSASGAGGSDPVAAFEELGMAAARYRKELSNAGRAFVDRVVDTLESLTVAATSSSVSGSWGDSVQVEANVSAAGIGFDWADSFEVGTVLEVEFSFVAEGAGVPFKFTAEVRRSIATDQGWNIGLSFQNLTQVSQQRLIRQIYDVQRLDLRGRSEKS
tara:strand:+ start:3178 stop:3753 length:576 start_codon:yes stop_codon:yes gene_type:complete